MVKVFISSVDSPLGYNLSRVLSSTVVGARHEEEPEEEQGGAAEEDAAHQPPATTEGKPEEKLQKETYDVVGTVHVRPTTADFIKNPLTMMTIPSGPGHMIETGDKKKDAARREAIEKMATLGEAPKWVKQAFMVNPRFQCRPSKVAFQLII